jgi:galactokinase
MNSGPGLVERFIQRWGGSPRLFRAPGRVNLIGEHTDYNDGFVFPAAIDFYTQVAIAPRPDYRLRAYSENYAEEAELDLQASASRPRKHWSDYVFGVALMLQAAGHKLSGADLLIASNVPLGSGLSSSAALEVAVASALLGISSISIGKLQLAQLCQRAENEFVGARCGIMDQFISSHAQRGTALLLDCRSLQYQLAPLPEEYALVACNTMVKHELASGEYNQRRAECEEGVRILATVLPQVRALRDVSPDQLEQHRAKFSPVVYRRCRHVVSEDQRVEQAAERLRQSDIVGFGKLMADSHRSLRDDYQVSCAELDLMVELANNVSGVAGARMTGGGFGGCTINLVRSESVAQFSEQITAEYTKRTGQRPDTFVSHPAAGAHEVPLSAKPVRA